MLFAPVNFWPVRFFVHVPSGGVMCIMQAMFTTCSPDRREQKRVTVVLYVLGIIASITAAAAFFGFPVIEALSIQAGEMTHFREAVVSVNHDLSSYLAAIFFWSILTLVLGFVWGRALFPNSGIVEKIALGLSGMVVVLHFNIVLAIILAAMTGTLDVAREQATQLFLHNNDQTAALANVLLAILLGILVLVAREIRRSRSRANDTEKNITPLS